jgi:C4-dicarboxylate transporter DctQ subunit
MSVFNKINDNIASLLFRIGMVGSFVILAVTFLNVLARYLFNSPFYWAEEVSSITFILLSLFPAAEIWKRRSHINFEIVNKKLSLKNQNILEIIICLISMVFTGVLTWQTFKATHMVYVGRMKEPSLLGTPLWIPYSIMLLGMAALFLRFFSTFWEDVKKIGK